MGREAYLSRLALGISAFSDPLRDDHGDFILGGQAHRYDAPGYIQQWDEKGRPQNLTSEKNAKRFYKAQNEILQACGLVVQRNAEKKSKRLIKETSESEQIKIMEEENETGFVLKYFENLTGSLMTWWVGNLKKRLLTFKPTNLSISEIFRAGISSSAPVSFLFGGLGTSTLDNILAVARDPYVGTEDMRFIDFLEMNNSRSNRSWSTTVKLWSKWLLFASVEVPLNIIATLQNLGFTILPVVVYCLKTIYGGRKLSFAGVGIAESMRDLVSLLFICLGRGCIYDEISWRTYMLLRQVLSRPQNPSKLSIKAAENDELDEGGTIVGIGRSLGSHTDQRFYGPQSFWPALRVAFPWVKMFSPSGMSRDKIKHETLVRCAMMEHDQSYHDFQVDDLAKQRASNIISNLESLGVNLEEDFYVDIDQWSKDISNIDTNQIFDDPLTLEAENLFGGSAGGNPAVSDTNVLQLRNSITSPIPASSLNIIEQPDGSMIIGVQSVPDDATVPQNQDEELAMTGASPPNRITSTLLPDTIRTDPGTLLSFAEEVDDIFAGVSFDDDLPNSAPDAQPSADGPTSNDQGQLRLPSTHREMERPLTPEPGIRRATSLSFTQTTPRPVRRSTETRDDTNIEDYLAEVLQGARKLEKKKKKIKDYRESRVTRMTVFASDSFAWHASSMITHLLLLPLNAIYCRRVASWFLSVTKELPLSVSIFPAEEIQLIDTPYSWVQGRMLLLSFGIECLIHGAVWQMGCGVARHYGRMYQWGKF